MQVSLQNLLKIGQLKIHPPDAREIEQLLVAARRNLRDAHVTSISPETRFDAAYKAVMQSGLAALMMHGYRSRATGERRSFLAGLAAAWSRPLTKISKLRCSSHSHGFATRARHAFLTRQRMLLTFL